MSDTVNVGLTDDQRELLLRGLRYVRSSVLLEIREPNPEADENRRRQLEQINSLTTQLGGASARAAARA